MSSDIEEGSPATTTNTNTNQTATPTPGCSDSRRSNKGENCFTACIHKTTINWRLVYFCMAALISLIILAFCIISLLVNGFDLPNAQQNVLWSLISAVIGLWFKSPGIKAKKTQTTHS